LDEEHVNFCLRTSSHTIRAWQWLHCGELRNWEIGEGGVMLFRPSRVPVVRYRYRGTHIPRHGDYR